MEHLPHDRAVSWPRSHDVPACAACQATAVDVQLRLPHGGFFRCRLCDFSWAQAPLAITAVPHTDEHLVSGVGDVRIRATGEPVGQYGYDLTFASGDGLPCSAVVDLPVAVAARCLAAGLMLELRQDGVLVTLEVNEVGPGGAELTVVDITVDTKP